MPVTQPEAPITVDILDEGMKAELKIPANLPVENVSEEACAAIILKARIDYNEDRADQVRQAVVRYAEDPATPITITFHGQPPEHGQDGQFEWDPKCDPANLEKTDDHAPNRVDFYNRSAFITVAKDQMIGRIIPPTMGQPGTLVSGQTVEPQIGQPFDLQTDETVHIDAEGVVRAKTSGVVVWKKPMLSVSPKLQVTDYVDFSTGNIDFAGDVWIGKGVRDKFTIRSGGNVEVMGLIEAATIECDGDFLAQGGMAAKEKGHVHVGGNVTARYFDNVDGVVKGSITVQREMINCELEIRGELNAGTGALIGGRYFALGCVTTASLGSPTGDKTIVLLGSAPAIQQVLAGAQEQIEKVNERLAEIDDRLQQLEQMKAGRAASQREMITEIMFERSELAEIAQRLEKKAETIRQWFESHRQVELHVEKQLHMGTTLVVDNTAITFDKDLRGPVTIGWDERHDIVIRDVAGNVETIKTVARLRPVRRKSREDALYHCPDDAAA
jgi:hypothetical protein